MRTLTSEQKPNWPVYPPLLVYAYNATLHSSTGFQPYELMFGHKAPMPCDNWLGLDNYKPESFKSKTIWLNQQLNSMLHVNKQALKLIKKSTKCNKDHTGGKELIILIRNHVLLHDHLEGCTLKFRTGTSWTYTSWLDTTRNLMSTISSFWTRVNQVLQKWSTDVNCTTLTTQVHLLWLMIPMMMMILQ